MPTSAAIVSSARQAIAEGRWEDAERLCRQYLRDSPEDPYASFLIGVVHLNFGRPEVAREALALACEGDPASDRARVWLSRALRKLNRKEEALRAAVDAAALNPSDPTILHHLGVCQLEAGEFAAAVASFRGAHRLEPDSALIQYFLGIALHRSGDLDGAAGALRNSLRLAPGDARTAKALQIVESELVVEGSTASSIESRIESLLRDGRPDEAELVCLDALEGSPEDPRLLFNMGLIKVSQGSLEEASSWLEQAWKADPTSARAPHLLSIALRSVGRVRDALAPALAAVENDPGAPGVQNQLGSVYSDLYRFSEAIVCFQMAIRAAPQDSSGYLQLADALQRTNQGSAAISTLRGALMAVDDPLPVRRSLVDALLQSGDVASAIFEARINVELLPDSAEARIGLAKCYLKDLKEDLARAELEEARRIGVRYGSTAYEMGKILQELGHVVESEALMLRSIELEASQGAAYCSIAHLRRTTEADSAFLEKMQELAADPAMSAGQRSLLHYGLGKSFEDLGRYEEAIRQYDSANDLAYREKFGDVPFDRQEFAASLERIGDLLEAEMGDPRSRVGLPSELPIFVIGMIRSGTTLVNQILSSHPLIGSVGEDGFWIDASRELLEAPLDFARLRAYADAYLVRLEGVARGKMRVVNKQPANSVVAPLIHMALPAAKILHVVRDPIDTCLSIYTTVNGARIEWAHDKANIAFAFREHEKLMERWRRLLPAGSMMKVAYEELVTEPERVSREMISYCGLEWDSACLKPEENPNPVMTPSILQSRRPVYRTSVGRWRKFEPWLSDFIF